LAGRLPAAAQRETDHWYILNNVGLDFGGGSPTPQHGYLTTGSRWQADIEGCSSISDANGRLLFYTNGREIVARDHNTLIGQGLFNCFSSSQGALIVPRPGSDRLYHVFHCDGELCSPNNSKVGAVTVDMARNGGLGGVVETAPLPVLARGVTEKLTAVRHRNGRDVWVLAHLFGNNAFVAFRVTEQGISADTVMSYVGTPHLSTKADFPDKPFPNLAVVASGCMKFSPDGTRLAVAVAGIRLFELFDFDDSTGRVSNPITLRMPASQSPYGVEFSPNSTKVYLSCLPTSPGGGDWFHQFDLRHRNAGDLLSNAWSQRIHPDFWDMTGSLQLGPDGKLYMARYNLNWLGVVHSPNEEKAACRFVAQGLQLTTSGGVYSTSTYALPNFITSYFYPKPVIVAERFCLGDTTKFSILNQKHLASVSWDFGEPSPGDRSTATSRSPSYRYRQAGEYVVTLRYAYADGRRGVVKDTLTIHPLPALSLGNDTTVCHQTPYLIRPQVRNGVSVTYRWQDGSTAATYRAERPGLYWVEAVSAAGCSSRDSLHVRWNAPLLDIGRDTSVCYSQRLFLDASTLLRTSRPDAKATYAWDDGSENPVRVVERPGTYWVRVDAAGCTDYDTVRVSFRECENLIEIPNVFTPNGDEDNPVFLAKGLQPGVWHLQVVNRWGELVYAAQGYDNNWDGGDLPTGMYYYQLTHPWDRRQYRGWVQILR
jgi:gliding motility-associated-like protein